MVGDGKIQALNNAIRQTIPHLQDVAAQNPYATMLVRALAFSTSVKWHIPKPTPIESLVWLDLRADGYTALGAALTEVAGQLRPPHMEPRALPPALVLISDGMPTDAWEDGLAALMAEPWGAKAVRLAVAIGRDADLGVLREFIGNDDVPPVMASDPEQLVYYIRWASTVAVKVASVPKGDDIGFEVPTWTPTGQGSQDVTW